MKKILVTLAIGVCMLQPFTARAAMESWKQQFAQVSDEYFDQVFLHYQPTQGTLAGYHQYDAQLEDYSRKNIDAEIADLKAFEQRVEAIHPDASAADFVPRSDREMVLVEYPLAVADAGNNSPVGEERG